MSCRFMRIKTKSKMPRDSRSYRKRSSSRERDRKKRSRSRSRSRRSRSRERVRRSRSRERKRSRSRDRDRRDKRKRSSSRDRGKRRSRSRSRSSSPTKTKKGSSKSPTPERKKISPTSAENKVKDEPIDKEEEQKRLEVEMQKRRERIEQWRAERKKTQELVPLNIAPVSRKWTLEDDDDEEEDGGGEKKNEDDELDPLDAYMQSVNDEVKVLKDKDKKPLGENDVQGKVVTRITTVVKKKQEDPSKNKGELMLNNMDALEYSSEEEEEDLDSTMANLNKRKKDLGAVDHEKIYYAPFRKAFYVEVPEITKMTQEEVDAYRNELEHIAVRGKHCPKPIKTWAQCGVSKKVMEALKKHKYEKPTPIQAQAIPAIMSGRDVIGIAKTGSGKTLAFVLPMIRHILDQPPLEENDGPIAVIMIPTRELALQIAAECKKFTKAHNLRAVCVYGGTGISEQIAELKRGCEIIVCTPGRMIDMLTANSGRVTNLRRVTYIVLDEADRMFDMGFEPQVMKIIDNVRPDRQTVMFSATFPRQMEALARRILNKPIEVQVGGRSVVCKDVTQQVILIEEDKKLFKLLELLGLYAEQGSILVFVDKQEHADDLMKDLLKHSYTCLSLHGGIDQYDRDSIIQDFKSGTIKLMVATSVAARGLDVKQLILVVNFDCPNHYEDYVHRCGRTGRAGNKGFAYTFITSEQGKYAGDIIKALELSGQPVPEEVQKLWDAYKEEAKALGKTVKSSSGFHGKGFKFDETEAQLADERKKLQKAALGLHDSDDEDGGAAVSIDQKIEDMFASRKRVTDVAKPMINQNIGAQNQNQGGQNNQQKLELARKLAAKINYQKNLGTDAPDISQQAAIAIMKGDSVVVPQVASKTIAEQLAEKLNARLGYKPQSEEEQITLELTPGETFKRYEEELDINDFPQTARWKVTSREALATISEFSEAGITVRGSYFPQGKEPKEGERKLYLAIEATSELAISKAKAEIIRLIKEELIRLQNSYQPINRGRYKVL
ncbi:probable ATP-dependent RNA helicase DDX46 isoform X2 [Biomphalaria glabrata]|uniref:Probable ATP-dependent RNA helicase DDX46 n=1 Tax=Biomphalaria glabrata TaxID=6526 RepID=A0A9W2ZP94_BIOGL|nr:probable ATP-dependent RNA helicase DDX46 isoform X2 [Biomphalaria glabrata]